MREVGSSVGMRKEGVEMGGWSGKCGRQSCDDRVWDKVMLKMALASHL